MILKKILQWLGFCKEQQKPLPKQHNNKPLKPWQYKLDKTETPQTRDLVKNVFEVEQNPIAVSQQEKIFANLYELDQEQKARATHKKLHKKALKGYKYNKGQRLTFDFIPSSQAKMNCRTFLEFKTGSFDTWQRLRNLIEKLNDGKCTCCGKNNNSYNDSKFLTECHEVWSFDTKTHIQKLVYLMPVCTLCHNVKHLNQGYSFIDDTEKQLKLQHYSYYNNITIEEANENLESCLLVANELASEKFILDMSLLAKFGVKGLDLFFDPHQEDFLKYINKDKEAH